MANRQDEHCDDLLDRAAEALRQAPVPVGPPPETLFGVLAAIEKADAVPPTVFERIKNLTPTLRLAVAATVLVAAGILVGWLVVGGGPATIAFAEVAKALDGLRTATFDETVQVKNPMDGKLITFKSRSLFLAPSRQRCEMSTPTASAKDKGISIMILDLQAMKSLTLVPEQKVAVAVDLSKLKKALAGRPTNMFEMFRQLVREGSSGGGEKVESLGKKEIDGRVVVGFRTVNIIKRYA